MLFYYSGHGVPDTDGDVYLATSEIDPDAPYRSGFSFSDLTRMMNRTGSMRVVGILDCCYSGAAKISKGVGKASAEEAAATLATNAINDKSTNLQKDKGVCLLAASQAAQEAYALKEAEHSIFTYYLLEGLKGNEKSVDSSGNVTADTLGKYVYREIINLPPEKRPKQTPIRKLEVGDEIILAHYPEYVEGYEQIIPSLMDEGDKYFLREEYDSAKNCYDRVIKINPNHVDAWYKKGNISYNLENLEEAIKCYNRVLLINPNHANAWYKKGITYKKKNNHDKALECYDKSTQIKANSSSVWYEKGLSLSYLKRYKEAIKYYDNAIEIKPDHAEAWYKKGYALYNMGVKDEAQSCYNRAKEINPDFPGEWYEHDNERYSPSSPQPGPEPVTISPPSQALPRQPAAAPLAQRLKQRTTLVIIGVAAAAAIALLLVVSQGNMFLPNNVPIANAGIDKTVDAGSLVTLNGSSSSDPDNNDMITSYKWEQTTGSPLIELDNPDSPSPSFTSPIITSDTKFTFRLTVTDQNNQSANDDVEITVKPVSSTPLSPSQPNDVPVGDNIDATTDQDTPVKIALSASDADNDPLEFAIGSFPSHGSLAGFDTSTNTVTYTPNQDYIGKDSFTFKVADNKGSLSDPATVSITIIPAPNNIPTVPAEQSILTDQDTSI
ncbi:MAG: tetratricopeptide repeat protein, partial [Thermoproteota archaeon]|nr:tetratricopeptide repeat protein [Thermoproteota archaeon]